MNEQTQTDEQTNRSYAASNADVRRRRVVVVVVGSSPCTHACVHVGSRHVGPPDSRTYVLKRKIDPDEEELKKRTG